MNKPTEPTTPITPITIIRTKAVEKRVSYTARHLLNLEKEGKFPKRRQLGPRRVGWVEAEIDAWLASREVGPAEAPFPVTGT